MNNKNIFKTILTLVACVILLNVIILYFAEDFQNRTARKYSAKDTSSYNTTKPSLTPDIVSVNNYSASSSGTYGTQKTYSSSDINGYNWKSMSYSEKKYVVGNALNDLRKSGFVYIVNEEWFIVALNNYYGIPSTDSYSLVYSIKILGIAGKVLIK